jgi:hypothetical protein
MRQCIHDNFLIVLIDLPTMRPMHIAILTFEGFNELDSLIALGILNRIKTPGWRVSIASPAARVRSMNGVVLEAQASLREASEADAVIVGSGMQTREVVADAALMAQLQLDPVAATAGRAVLRRAGAGEAGAARWRSGLHGPDDQALGPGRRHRRAEPALRRAQEVEVHALVGLRHGLQEQLACSRGRPSGHHRFLRAARQFLIGHQQR